ncbi:MAG: NAD-dependent epimerase/dehydratase family protein [Planctomycetaceae bacterium]|jgi:nucleoside-diphosphate-sugar epimerase|nr:NAD-dependent epimerase/dehydratase family protein [Planctomycetaceae bacterium]MBT4013833.1 NAD-dependent epimerase/dehydratase family protein [Planctomycetaceae bacterium]MBT4725804.1 NAD-dependent epimerase/dehydratase family protein [Planctomycetaceae bacterium]MBT4847098.1 NAD-dependent epimerase/dehydratase family protein [Planctomycetaceae bacterium]MBT5125612.1 NAD-dependent epimerase/dehydratase family protein [Planctomycetaceae bacterium]
MTKRLIIGCGYLGFRVAKLWQILGHDVHLLTRSEQTAAMFEQQGFTAHLGDVTQLSSLDHFPAATEVLYAVGFDRAGNYDIHDVYCQGLKNVIERLPQAPNRFIHISSTGVYGQIDGSLVDEETLAEPLRPGGTAALAAEQALRQSLLSTSAVSLRLGGIYGPRRVPYLKQIVAGEPLAVPSQGWLNLLHVEDAVQIIELLCQAPPQHDLYLVTDGVPVLRQDYLNEIARLLQAPEITWAPSNPNTAVAQRALGSKRINTRRFVDELKYNWKYPSYREGLASILSK